MIYRLVGPKPGIPGFESVVTEDINGVIRRVEIGETIELNDAQLDDIDEYAHFVLSDEEVVTAEAVGEAAVIRLAPDVVPQEGDVITYVNGRWDVTQPQ